ncbi:hypothetical protein NJI34_27970 [Pseudomonas sp. S 311-6]|uniref:hypothetical protein n=1 Tax=Pseudomonas TaxID=286 RepID=UPI001CE3C639|nr:MULTISPECIES: hypothetical protein [Pseudomonas]MCO7640613.1 hypothetical protein [Pseudomonas sp. S 311-6]MCO7566062.1 hypothetical protein [Pseudomonas mosselii]MCO7596199.1 hypothetical protein [Pseudomonas guariconensis]MCO7617229.1 hypothetical protein [Pseudomonas guariconensis]MCU7220279.1 hypothetical protein [Pseudomonas brassicacearum]
MVGITAINIPAASLPNAGEVSEAGQGRQREGRLQVDVSGLRGGERAQQAQSAEDSSEPPHIKQLREMIKKLQKQLAEEQKQLAELMQREMDETSKLAAVSAKQASIATLNGEILAATAQLLEALSKAGGSSAGGMVSTQA